MCEMSKLYVEDMGKECRQLRKRTKMHSVEWFDNKTRLPCWLDENEPLAAPPTFNISYITLHKRQFFFLIRIKFVIDLFVLTLPYHQQFRST